MPNIGSPGLLLIVVAALLLFGPSKLPELGRAFGRTVREFKAGMREITSDEEEAEESREAVRESKMQIAEASEQKSPIQER